MNVLQAIKKSSDFLLRKDVESPRLQAEWLLAHVLGLQRMALYLNFDRVLSEVEIDRLRLLVTRRSRREPLQHIIGNTSFLGLEITVNREVLIPRPETEILAIRAGEVLEKQFPPGTPLKILDIGTGSGCIAIWLAKRFSEGEVTAVDISPTALEIATINARTHGVEGKITFILGDCFDSLAPGLKFDLVVSNPPYIPTEEIPSLSPEVRDFDPKLALDGGEDGLMFYRLLAGNAARFMNPKATLIAEFGDGQADPVREILEKQNWIVEGIEPDYSGRNRFVFAQPAT